MKNCNLVFIISAIAAAVATASADTLDDARAAMTAHDFDAAYDLYTDYLFTTNEVPPLVHYEQGTAALAVTNYARAAACYERAVTVNPAFIRARSDLARCYLALGLFDDAREQFGYVLDSPVPQEVRDTVGRYLAAMENAGRRWSFNGSASVSAFYDSNVNYGPVSDVIDTVFGKMRLADADEHEAFGIEVAVENNFAYRLSPTPLGWYAFLWGGAAQSFPEGEMDYAIGYEQFRAGLRRLGRNSLVEIAGKFDSVRQDDYEIMNVAGFEPVFVYVQGPELAHSLRATAEYRNYMHSYADDSNYAALEYSIRLGFGENAISGLRLSLRGYTEDADYEAMSNKGYDVMLNGDLDFFGICLLYAGAGYGSAEYDKILFPMLQDKAREDDIYSVVVGARRRLYENTVCDLSYRHIDRNSSLGLYEYNRDIVSARVVINW